MKKRKTGKNRKAKSAKKKLPVTTKPVVISQLNPLAFSPEKFMARFNEQSRRGNWDLVGDKIIEQLNLLTKLPESEDPLGAVAPQASQVIERIVNRLVEILQLIEKGSANSALKEVVQDQMAHSAAKFAAASLDVLERVSEKPNEVLALTLVKTITLGCERIKKVAEKNRTALQWIAEKNVFLPSIRGIKDSYDDNFPHIREVLRLAKGLDGINLEKARITTPAFNEVLRFYRKAEADIWLPPFPPRSNDPDVLHEWHRRLDEYLERTVLRWDKHLGKQVELKINKERILKSGAFDGVKGRIKVKDGGEKEGVIWDQIKKACRQVLRTMAQP